MRELRLRIQPSGVKTFYVQIARGKRERIGTYPGHTLEKARNKAKTILGRAADGHDFQAERRQKKILKDTTLLSYLDGPFKKHAEANIVSHKDMRARIRKVFHYLLDKPMTEIAEADMTQWREEREKVSLETRRRELTYLKSLLNHAVSTGAVPYHQLTHYKVKGTVKEGEGRKKVRYLSDSEEARLRAALDAREAGLREARDNMRKWQEERGHELSPPIKPTEYADHIKPIVLLALNTGLRRGDLFDLQWEHVDLHQRQIRKVIQKTSHARRKAGKRVEETVLPISSEAHEILSQCQKQAAEGAVYVFPSPATGGPLTDIKKGFNAVVDAAKIRNFSFHDLRHTFASRLVMAGVDINTVRELMTHSDIKMTLVYAHLSPDHKAAALEKAFGGAA